jgi:hypothetical protein
VAGVKRRFRCQEALSARYTRGSVRNDCQTITGV